MERRSSAINDEGEALKAYSDNTRICEVILCKDMFSSHRVRYMYVAIFTRESVIFREKRKAQ